MSQENVELVRGRLLPLALVLLIFGVVMPSPALAVRASSTGFHGPPGGVYGGRSSQVHPMSLRLTRDGGRVRSWLVHVDAGTCTSSPTAHFTLPVYSDARDAVLLHADGSFRQTGRFTGQAQLGDTVDFKLVIKGRVGRTRATGTIRLFGPVSDANGTVIDRCDSGIVRWRLGRGNVYGGATDDHTAVSVRLARDHKLLRSFFIDLVFVCRSGTTSITVNQSLKHLSVPVRRDGSFSKRSYSLIPFETFQTPLGETATGQFLLRGKLGSRLASGSYRAFGTVRETDGRKWSCDTGPVRWTARRG